MLGWILPTRGNWPVYIIHCSPRPSVNHFFPKKRRWSRSNLVKWNRGEPFRDKLRLTSGMQYFKSISLQPSFNLAALMNRAKESFNHLILWNLSYVPFWQTPRYKPSLESFWKKYARWCIDKMSWNQPLFKGRWHLLTAKEMQDGEYLTT